MKVAEDEAGEVDKVGEEVVEDVDEIVVCCE